MKYLYALFSCLIVGTATQAQNTQTPSFYSVEATAKTAPFERTSTQAVPANRAVHFSEDFESGTFPPTGWTVYILNYSRTTFSTQNWHDATNGNPGNCASVVYVNSVDQHDEWMATPAITIPNTGGAIRLEFEINTSQFWHVTPNDNADIRCYISTVSGSITDLLAGTEVFWEQDPAYVNDWETFVWWAYQYDLSAFAGQTIYMGWHYDGLDGAQFNLDNISIYDVPDNDLTINNVWAADINTDYEIRLYDYLQLRPIGITGVVYNNGGAAQPNAGYDYIITDGSGTIVDQGASTTNIASLAPGAQDTVFFQTAYTPPAAIAGNMDYTVLIVASSDSTDSNNNNDSLSRGITVSSLTWSLENGLIDGGITNVSGGTGDPVSFGNQMIATTNGLYNGMWLGFGPNAVAGELAYGAVYLFDINLGEYVYVDQTNDHTITASDAGNYVYLPFVSGFYTVNAGDQLLVVIGHFGGANDVEIGTSGNSVEGTVLGFDGSNALFNLLSPPTIAVRLSTEIINVEEFENGAFLGQSIPNPASNEVRIPFELATANTASLRVYDITGKQVFEADMGNQPAGPNTIRIATHQFEAGVYTYTLTVGDTQYSKQMVIAR